MVVSNILDPVHDTLDPTVWDAVQEHFPVLKPQHKGWILDTIHDVFKRHGYGDMDKWLEVYFTGSLTTFQYSDDSDVDVSIFVNTDVFPEWSRAEMIGIMVSEFDNQRLPGTTHPMQCFVVAKGIRPHDLYKPGLRSGYLIAEDRWLVPPERDRVHNVQAEQNADYQYALQQADKMERLLRYEPHKAIQFWHQIHMRRMSDQKQGKGDFSQSNIIYKFLSNRGLFPQISEVSGEHIAGAPPPWGIDHDAVERARKHLGLRWPVKVNLVKGTSGKYQGAPNDQHEIELVSWLRPESASKQLWHELAHAVQHERDPQNWLWDSVQYADTYEQGHQAYRDHPWEVEARGIADSAPFSLIHGHEHLASDTPRVLYNNFNPEKKHPPGPNGAELPFTYDPEDNVVHLGPANSLHWELIARTPELRAKYPMDKAYSQFSGMLVPKHLHGRMEWPGKLTHFMGLTADNDHRDAVNAALGATSAPDTDWGSMFESNTNTEGQYVGNGQKAAHTGGTEGLEDGPFRGAHQQAETLAPVSGNLWTVLGTGEARPDDRRSHHATV